jgi:type 1 glutamine amidotransferase
MRQLAVLIGLGMVGLFVVEQVGSISHAAEPTQVLIVVGPSDHPPGSHEVAAGGRLMRDCLQTATNVPAIRAEVVDSWPTDRATIENARTVVFIGDTFPAERLPDSDRAMRELGGMMQRGCGIVCVHYATGLRAEDVADDGDHPLLQWMGGYFATRCKHHQSVARIFPEATITHGENDHPLQRGWKSFTVHDEPYINNYFGKDGNRLAVHVTPIAVSMLPPENPHPEIVAWAVQRSDQGRGFGIVMPHFYRNWRQDDLRTLIMNGIVWTAGLDVPNEGVSTAAPDLAKFEPASIEPKPRAK